MGGFFLGSVMFSKILPKRLAMRDIEKEGRDGNPGAANVFMHCGVKLGLTCLMLDMLKGFIPVYLAITVFGEKSPLIALVILAPALGHAIAPLNGFKGGKCISTVFGELIALLKVTPVVLILAALYIIFSTVVKIDPNRVRSIWTFSLFIAVATPFLLYFGHSMIAVGCVLASVTAIVKHTKYFVNEAQASFEESLQEVEPSEEAVEELAEQNN